MANISVPEDLKPGIVPSIVDTTPVNPLQNVQDRLQAAMGPTVEGPKLPTLDAFLKQRGIKADELSPERRRQVEDLQKEENPQEVDKKFKQLLSDLGEEVSAKMDPDQRKQFESIQQSISNGDFPPEQIYNTLKGEVTETAKNLPEVEQQEAMSAIEELAAAVEEKEKAPGKPISMERVKKAALKLIMLLRIPLLLFGGLVGMWLLKGMMGGGGRGH